MRHILLLVFVPVFGNIGILSGISHCDPEILHGALTIGFRPDWIPGVACFVDPTVAYVTQPLGFLSAEDWLHGVVPWWNPYTGVGMPLAAEMSNESFFLPVVLLLHFHSGWVLQRLIFQILSGLFTYLFLLELPLVPAAALVGGLLYSLNGAFTLTAHAVTGTIFCLPLLMLGVEKARRATLNSTAPGWSLFTLALALSVYAGFPEVAFFDGLFALAWILLRFFQMPVEFRRRFAFKILIGGLTGLGLTMPLIIPFAEYLATGSIGAHAKFFSQAVLPQAAAPIQLLPLFYGALAIPQTPQWQNIFFDMWTRFGGWFGCAPVLLALYALFAPATQKRAERYFFAIWVLVWECRYFGFPGAKAVFNLIPGVAQADAVRFSGVSVMFALFCLAASGFNDAAADAEVQPRRLYGALSLFGACLCLAVTPALWILPLWFHAHPKLIGYAAVYLAGTAAAFGMLVYAVRFGRGLKAAGVMMIAGSVAIFLLPQFYGTVTGEDEPGIAKLQSIIGFSRFYSMGAFWPNYPALHHIASINYVQLPVPKIWSDFIGRDLFPEADLVSFTGGEPGQDWALIAKFPNYEAIGVKYVVTLPFENPLQWQFSPHVVSAPSGFMRVLAGAEISGVIAARNWPPAKINCISIVVGTYAGQSTGSLQAELCADGKCAIGTGELSQIADGTRFNISLDKTLELSPGDVLAYKFIHPDGRAVAIWLAADPRQPGDTAASVMARPDGTAALVFDTNGTETAPVTYMSSTIDPGKLPVTKQIFHDGSMNIYELPDPAPYAELSDKSCSLMVLTRQKMIARCGHPTVLTRRELFFPGWWAAVNGNVQNITKTQEIFQGLGLPAGRSEIRFFYMPPYTYAACAIAMIAGLFWAGAVFFRPKSLS